MGMTRKKLWGCRRFAEIPEAEFETLMEAHRNGGRRLGALGILRAAGVVAPDKPRPPECARAQAVEILEQFVMYLLDRLQRDLRENGTDEQLELASKTATAVDAALDTLRRVTRTPSPT